MIKISKQYDDKVLNMGKPPTYITADFCHKEMDTAPPPWDPSQFTELFEPAGEETQAASLPSACTRLPR
jgi:hypothetical protein